MSSAMIKYLEFIQAAITRLAGNSFLIRGWCVTLVVAVFGLVAKDSAPQAAWLAFLPITLFWGLDTYYLRQERLFRLMFQDKASNPVDMPDFSLDPAAYLTAKPKWTNHLRVATSATILPLYGILALSVVATYWYGSRALPTEPVAKATPTATPWPMDPYVVPRTTSLNPPRPAAIR